MCLFLFSSCTIKDCKDCLRGCFAGCPNPLVALFNLLVAIPLTVVVLMVGGLVPALARWPMGSWRNISDMWKHIGHTLNKGKQAYDSNAVNAPPQQQLSTCACCDAIIAEAYCCCIPIFVVITPLLPAWLLLLLLIDILCATLGGACGGSCVERLSDWWPLTARQLRRIDEQIARTCGMPAHGAPYFWPCIENINEADMLPHHAPPPTNIRPVAQAHAPPPQQWRPPTTAPPVARPVAPPQPGGQPAYPPPQNNRGPPPIEQQVIGVAGSLAFGVARAGVNAFFGGGRGQVGQAQPPPAGAAMPRARAVPAGGGGSVPVAMPVAQGVPMGRPVGR